MLEDGKNYAGTVVSTMFKAIGSKPALQVTLEAGGENHDALIWLTPKALESGMARQQIKALGFDPDAAPVSDLEKDPSPVKGKLVACYGESYNGTVYLKIETPNKLTKKQMAEIQKAVGKGKAKADKPDDDLPF